MVDKENIESISGLAAMQKGMFFSYAVDTGSDAYVEQFDFTGSGPLDADLLRTALVALSRHYSVLRTVFSFRNTDDPYQIVLKEWPPTLSVLDLRDRIDTDAAVAEFKAADRARGFDLETDVLLRAALIHVADGRWHLVITFHHILIDGWSLGPLFGTLFDYYDQLVRTGTVEQGTEAHPYRQYVDWYEQQRTEDARRHWAAVLDGYEQPAGLPADREADEYAGRTHRFSLPPGLQTDLDLFVRQERVTHSAVFHAAWGVVLQKFGYADDVVFGSVVSGRGTGPAGVDTMVGLFVNTLPVRVSTPSGGDFLGLCRAAQDSYRQAAPYEYFPLHEVQSETPLKNALLDHVVAFENYPLSAQLREFDPDGTGPRFEGVEVFERTSYDLHIVVNPAPEFTVTFTYNAHRYSPDLMESLEAAIVRVLAAGTRNPQVRIDDIALAEPDDRHGRGPAVSRSLSTQSSVIDLFADVVAARGDATAVVQGDRQYTYSRLDRWSDAVAWRLRERGVEPGVGVGVLVDRRPELLAAILGLLKNGNFYVPVDLKDAPARIEYVLRDAEAGHVCTVPEIEYLLPATAGPVPLDEPEAAVQVQDFPRHRLEPDAVAYLMYTSGSTGAPKGCYTTHRNIQRLVVDQAFYDFGPDQVVLQTSPPAFDAFTWELWGTVLFGATLVQPDDEIDLLDGQRLRDLIEHHGVRSMWLSAPLFNQLCDQDPTIFASLRHLLVGGSALSVQHIAKVSRENPGLRITNGYGPTENTTFTTTHEITSDDLLRSRIPIGHALNHSTAYVLDRGLNLAAPGAIGELCAGGDGVAIGYHKQPELTAAKFVTVGQLPDERLYRTGDLVRMLPDGTLDYVGRSDDQVKVNGGFRVELGEVESVLKSLEGIEDAVVTAVERSGGKELAAYYVAAGALTPPQVRQQLATRLAGYMLPPTLVRMDAIPLNKNGKVDRGRLADAGAQAGADNAAPARHRLSTTERMLHDVVADVIEADGVDVDRNFFDVGLTSLSLLALNNRLRKTHSLDLPLTMFFEHTSISSLAAYLDNDGGSDDFASREAVAEVDEQAAIATTRLLRQLADESEGSFDNV